MVLPVVPASSHEVSDGRRLPSKDEMLSGRMTGPTFNVRAKDGHARVGQLVTKHGSIPTPTALIYTRRGGPMGLTPDLLEKLQPTFGVQIDVLQLCVTCKFMRGPQTRPCTPCMAFVKCMPCNSQCHANMGPALGFVAANRSCAATCAWRWQQTRSICLSGCHLHAGPSVRQHQGLGMAQLRAVAHMHAAHGISTYPVVWSYGF